MDSRKSSHIYSNKSPIRFRMFGIMKDHHIGILSNRLKYYLSQFFDKYITSVFRVFS